MGKNRKKSSSYRKNSRLPLDKRNSGFKKSRRNNSNYEPSAGIPNGAETVYRILCPTKKIGGVIGKGGDIIKALRDETRAKIKIDETVPGTDERVVIIFSSSTRKPRASSDNEDPENDAPDEKEHESMQLHCPAQHALLRVHERIAEEEDLYGVSDHEDSENSVVTARLLVPSNQAGCLLGKGGHVIQRLRSETGANIRILPPEHLPACAMSTDELVQISGASDVAKKALYEISTLLYQNPRPPINYPEPAGGPGFYPPGPPMGNMPPPGNPMWSHRNSGFHGPPPMPWGGGFGNEFPRFGPGGFNSGPAGNSGKASAEFNMKILCPADKIGVVIGKGGSNVKQIQQETGANIHVEDSTGEADERVILVSCFDAPWNPRSPTIDAILQLQVHTHEISEKGIITTRLLVPSSRVGCLLGQGGHIITEMRRRCQADIRVISKDGKPKCASAEEELVQISGNANVARNALSEIASRLRVRSLEGVSAAAEQGPMGPFPGFGPSEGFPDRGLPPPGMLGPGSSGSYEHTKGGAREYEASSYPVQSSGAGPAGYPNIHSSMEIKIPNSAISSLLGAGGSNISSIGQISGAKVKLNDPQVGGSECVVQIHGSSEQMNAAQNLLHSFIASAAQNFTTQPPQQAHAAPAVQSYYAQQQESPYAAAQNYSVQQHQQSSYPSAVQNYTAQQHPSSYASAAQNYGAQKQQQSPYASAAHNFDPQQQQHSHYAAAAMQQNYDPQQQHKGHYSSAAMQQNYDPQQQHKGHYSSAAVMYEAQQQQGSYQY